MSKKVTIPALVLLCLTAGFLLFWPYVIPLLKPKNPEMKTRVMQKAGLLSIHSVLRDYISLERGGTIPELRSDEFYNWVQSPRSVRILSNEESKQRIIQALAELPSFRISSKAAGMKLRSAPDDTPFIELDTPAYGVLGVTVDGDPILKEGVSKSWLKMR